ncbi:MAG: hypothetical protein ACRED7_06650 [Stellaceae bacterium]
MKSVCIVGAAALMAVGVSGCVPVIGAVTLSDLLTGTSVAATALTGKSLSDDALSAATGDDCSVMDAALEKDRHICEANGAPATQGDFKGLIGMARAKPAVTPIAVDVATAASPTAQLAAADASSGETPAQPRATADLQPGDGASRVVN